MSACKPALLSFARSSGTSATRRSPGNDSLGTLTIMCADALRRTSRFVAEHEIGSALLVRLMIGENDPRGHALAWGCLRRLAATRFANLPKAIKSCLPPTSSFRYYVCIPASWLSDCPAEAD